MTKLLVVESPSKAKTISKIVGSEFAIRPTVGHILDLAKGRGEGIGVDIKNGFKPKYEVIPDKKDKIASIVDAAAAADEIYIASDPDREGEGIAWHVKSQIEHLGKPIKRVEFHEITKAAVLKAIKNPRDLDKNLFDAQQARRVLDRIVGFMVSPYLSKKLGDPALSAGRVQSVALKMIVEREIEIETFVAEEFFIITADLLKDKEGFQAKYSGPKVTDAKVAKQIAADIENAAKIIVKDVTSDTKLRPPPAPLTTSKLQQDASAKFKFDADRTMKAAQSLYEAGHVSYIRSDSTRSSPESIEAVREYLTKIGKKIPTTPNVFKNKDAAQDAHEAIRPTDVSLLPEKLVADEDQKKVYGLIWAMFVSSQMTPAVYDTVHVTITAGAHELKAEGKIQREAGWLDIAKNLIKKDADLLLPAINKNDILSLKKVVVEKKKTTPPSRFNDGTLVKDLEHKGVGRPSTYASIIARISNRKYVKKGAKGFEPTPLGRTVVENLSEFFSFMSYKYTADMEKKLDDISEGNLGYEEMLTEFFDGFKVEFQRARGNEGMDTEFPCPVCGENTVVRKSPFGFFAGCVKYPVCKGIIGINIIDGKVVAKNGKRHDIVENVQCPECNEGMVMREDGKFGPFYSCSNYPKCKGKRKVPYGKKCPDCGNELYATLFGDHLKLACMGYPDCKHVENLDKDVDGTIRWVDPKKVTPPVYAAKVEKLLK